MSLDSMNELIKNKKKKNCDQWRIKKTHYSKYSDGNGNKKDLLTRARTYPYSELCWCCRSAVTSVRSCWGWRKTHGVQVAPFRLRRARNGVPRRWAVDGRPTVFWLCRCSSGRAARPQPSFRRDVVHERADGRTTMSEKRKTDVG